MLIGNLGMGKKMLVIIYRILFKECVVWFFVNSLYNEKWFGFDF